MCVFTRIVKRFIYFYFISFFTQNLKDVLADLVPKEQNRIKNFKQQHGKTNIGQITVDMVSEGRRAATSCVVLSYCASFTASSCAFEGTVWCVLRREELTICCETKQTGGNEGFEGVRGV